MTPDFLPDIPRLHTGLAEWLACLVYLLPVRSRLRGVRFWFLAAGFLAIQSLLQILAGQLPLTYWIAGMAAAGALMYGLIRLAGRLNPQEAGYYWARAFLAAELAASLEWQINAYFLWLERYSLVREWLVVAVVYTLVFGAVYLLESRRFQTAKRPEVTNKDLLSALLISLSVFAINNIHFAFPQSIVSSTAGRGLFYIRTLVNFSGMIMLFVQQEMRHEFQLRYELKALDDVLNRQYVSYQQTKESIDLVNRKYHDLKHQIQAIRAEWDPQKREQHLKNLENDLKGFAASHHTGNAILDTVLTEKQRMCQDQGISLTCVVNGQLLDFMDTMDICTIFGNALDNAIESSAQTRDADKRIIQVSVYDQNHFLMISFENYFETALDMVDDLPQTTKGDHRYHGYGIKSIISTSERYGGHVTIKTDDHWFVLRILIPLGAH